VFFNELDKIDKWIQEAETEENRCPKSEAEKAQKIFDAMPKEYKDITTICKRDFKEGRITYEELKGRYNEEWKELFKPTSGAADSRNDDFLDQNSTKNPTLSTKCHC
jgi:hypothetical protein